MDNQTEQEQKQRITQSDKNRRAKIVAKAIKAGFRAGTAVAVIGAMGSAAQVAYAQDEANPLHEDESGNLLLDVESERQAETVSIPEVIYGNEAELRGKVLITIDDCASEELTRRMFETLNSRGLRATFFPNTTYMVGQDPQLWRDIVAAGFEIGYHTQNHDGNMSVSQLEADFVGFETSVRQVLGDENYQVTVVRPPYGSWDENWNAWVGNNGLHTVRWGMVPSNDAGMDYFRAVIDRGVPGTGPIVLLHPREFDAAWLDENIGSMMDLVGGQENADATTFPTVSGAFADGDLGLSWTK